MQTEINRLKTLNNLFYRYKHRYDENASNRLLGWIDEYNRIKGMHPRAFAQYCEEIGADPTHHALDCLA